MSDRFPELQLTRVAGDLEAGLMSGASGEVFMQKYRLRVENQFDNNLVLNTFSYSTEKVVTGGNVLSAILAGQVLRELGADLELTTPADFDKIVRSPKLTFSDFSDSESEIPLALVLRTEQDPNKYYAKILAEQNTQKLPAMIPLAALDVVVAQGAPNGLSLILRDTSAAVYWPDLNHDGYFKSVDAATGLPEISKGSGVRRQYSREHGLAALLLSNHGDFIINEGNLLRTHTSNKMLVVRRSREPSVAVPAPIVAASDLVPAIEVDIYYPPHLGTVDIQIEDAIRAGRTLKHSGIVSRDIVFRLARECDIGTVSTTQGYRLQVRADGHSRNAFIATRDRNRLRDALDKTNWQATIHYLSSESESPVALTVP